MCSVCLQNPCDSRCPNAPEPKPVCLCSECNEGIYEGDKYLEGVNGPVCTTCLSDMTTILSFYIRLLENLRFMEKQ